MFAETGEGVRAFTARLKAAEGCIFYGKIELWLWNYDNNSS